MQQRQDQHAELVSLYNLHFVVLAQHSKLHTVSMLCMLVHKCVCSSMSAVADGALIPKHPGMNASWQPFCMPGQCEHVCDATHPINKSKPFLLQDKVVRRELERWPGFAGPWLHMYIQHLYITCFVAGADGSHGAVMNF